MSRPLHGLFNLYNRSVFPVGIETALGNNLGRRRGHRRVRAGATSRPNSFGRGLRGNSAFATSRPTQTSSGYTFTAGAPLLSTVERTYSDTLPSLNLVLTT